MKNGKLGFIGIGNMASAIIGGILSSGTFPVGDIYMYNPHAEKMQRFTESGCGTTCHRHSRIELNVLADCSIHFLDLS